MSKKIKISPVHLQWWCKTSVVDEIVCHRKGISFDADIAREMEKETRHYFVVDKKGNSTVVSGSEFEKYFDNKEAPVMNMTEAGKSAIDRFIKRVHRI